MNLSNIYPYLIPGLINPDWEPITIPIGHGVYATLFLDLESEGGIVHRSVVPEDLEKAGVTAAELHDIALDNLARFAAYDGPGCMGMKMIGEPDHEVNFLLFCDHARAAACLRLPNLFAQASQWLQTTDICACAPQRESLIVLPKRDRAYRMQILDKIRQIEADARRPISFELFELSPEGVRPFYEA